MNTPNYLSYAKTHEWVKWLDEQTALIGITDHAQAALGDIVFINLPEVNAEVTVNETFGDIESVKAVSDVYAPVSGKVLEVNTSLLDKPENINSEPYESWFIKVGAISAKADLLNAEEYEQVISEE